MHIQCLWTLRDLALQALQADTTISEVRDWLNRDSAYDEEHFAEVILERVADTSTSLPIVVLVGKGHLKGLIKALYFSPDQVLIN